MSACRGMVIQPDGGYEFRAIRDHTDIQAAVGSENFDWSTPSALMFYCYGFALYEQPINPLATELYWHVYPPAKELGHQLAGSVLVTGPAVAGDETDIPDEYVLVFLAMREQMGQEEIARRAVRISDEDVAVLKAQQDQFQAELRERLASGQPVDVGGLIIGPAEAIERMFGTEGQS